MYRLDELIANVSKKHQIQKSDIKEASGGIRQINFNDAQNAEKVVETFLEVCGEQKHTITPHSGRYHFQIGVACDNDPATAGIHAKMLLDAATIEGQRREKTNEVATSIIFISHDVYEHLPSHIQDYYRAMQKVQQISAHLRFSIDFRRCFVISPIGEPESEVRNQADYVYNNFIKPACDSAGYRPVRADMMTSRKMVPEMMESLETAYLVLAYLGYPKPSWNSNVMLEVGFRLATGQPMVFLRDRTTGEKEDPLPFDLKDDRCTALPRFDDKIEDEDRAAYVKTIRLQMKEAAPETYAWKSPHPFAAIEIHTDDHEKNRYIECSDDLEELFEFTQIAGTKLQIVIDHLLSKMPEYQRDPFLKEQADLVAQLNMGANPYTNEKIKIEASVPIVFEQHEKYAGRAFLPVIMRHSSYGNTLRLRVIYLDVTDVAEKKGEFFVSKLAGSDLLKLDDKHATTSR